MSDIIKGGQFRAGMILPIGTNGESNGFGRMIVTKVEKWSTYPGEWNVCYNSLSLTAGTGSFTATTTDDYEVVGFLNTSPLSVTGIPAD